MHCILFDDHRYSDFLPLVFTRPIGDLRMGIYKISEKWQNNLGAQVSFNSNPSLNPKFSMGWGADNWIINARFLPTMKLVQQIKNLKAKDSLWSGDDMIAVRLPEIEIDRFKASENFYHSLPENQRQIVDETQLLELKNKWDLFRLNDKALALDFSYLTTRFVSQKRPDTLRCIGDQIFIEEGADVSYATINTSTGPVYIGKNAKVMEGATIRGPFALLENSEVKMGAKIYGATTVGPHSKVGGELNNVVIHGYSNKNHDGFLGNAVLGEWCNLGADTNNSNLKNNYASIKTWSYATERFEDTGLQFCGLAMGDHSKTGINTMLNTGTVIGVGCNVFGAGYPRTFIPSFSWGGSGGRTIHKLNKFFETAEIVMERRGQQLSENDKVILSHIFNETKKYRA